MSGGDDGESRWSYTAGRRPYRVRVYERADRSNLYIAVWDPEEGVVKRSLGHDDRERAKDRADELAPKIRAGAERLAEEENAATLRHVFRLYRRHKVPDKSEAVQAGDERRMKRWTRFLGADFDLEELSVREWDDFKRKRRSGEIDASGEPVPASRSCPDCGGEGCPECDGSGKVDPRRPVGDRTVEKDLRFLRSVCNWARNFREDGERLLGENPTDGLSIPK